MHRMSRLPGRRHDHYRMSSFMWVCCYIFRGFDCRLYNCENSFQSVGRASFRTWRNATNARRAPSRSVPPSLFHNSGELPSIYSALSLANCWSRTGETTRFKVSSTKWYRDWPGTNWRDGRNFTKIPPRSPTTTKRTSATCNRFTPPTIQFPCHWNTPLRKWLAIFDF